MNIFNKKKEELKSGEVRELLRENLKLINLDMFYTDDPIIDLEGDEKVLYLKFFFDLLKEDKLIHRLKYHINKQAIKTLGNSKDGIEDLAGAMNINGMAFIINDIERLANLYIKETAQKQELPIDKFAIIPEVG